MSSNTDFEFPFASLEFNERILLNISSVKKDKVKKKGMKIKKKGECTPRPNYFLAIKISNPQIHHRIVEAQRDILSYDKGLFESLIDVATLHLTLLVLHISSEEDLHVACSALDHCGAILGDGFSRSPLQLSFKGIGHFSNKVIFAKIQEDDQYKRLISAVKTMNEKFSEMGVQYTDNREDYHPHLTIAKLSKLQSGKGRKHMMHIRKIDTEAYEHHLGIDFGQQTVSGIEFLSMTKSKDSNRYYYKERETIFDVHPRESIDHSSCCFPRQPSRKFYSTASPPLNPIQVLGSSLSNSSTLSKVIIGSAVTAGVAFGIAKWMKKY